MIKKSSYKGIIVRWLKMIRQQDPNGGWVHEYKIRSVHTPFGWIGARGDRDTRELIKMGYLDKRMDGVYTVVRYNSDNPSRQQQEMSEEEKLAWAVR